LAISIRRYSSSGAKSRDVNHPPDEQPAARICHRKVVHGLGVAVIAAVEVLQILLPLLVAYFALPLLTLPPEADILGRKFILMLLIGSIGFAIVRTASLSHEISAAA
jgi:hypothetical protein